MKNLLQLTRAVTKSECSWLEHDLDKDEIVEKFTGYTYGVIGPNGAAVLVNRDGWEGFYEVPIDALADLGAKP